MTISKYQRTFAPEPFPKLNQPKIDRRQRIFNIILIECGSMKDPVKGNH
ncbi:predicted protein [Sclerotinia sclerotiorum 1980 UF-70]|uniref:Uncharacterized protein n=1 Tax=Sclerotinia sclerotiorum (strain ATCC 18683 / 1980 / Ss-1) TaxID=665079 RepID=A7EDM0_SCLS1|nr:predicted protein [Sclerotinia sclerotiorum 1980 UF-70]EDO00936.1 predicted protein [Sclerotinia sclerotiorum 1980 UF-70]